MDGVCTGLTKATVSVRVAAVTLVLLALWCGVPQGMETSALARDGGDAGTHPRVHARALSDNTTLPPALSADDWTTILNHLRHAGSSASSFVSEVARLIADDRADGDRFGYSVAVSGDVVVIGAYRDDDACPTDPDCDSGSVYVFERNRGGTADNWGQVRKLTASDAAAGDHFGWSVAISGDTIVIGAPYDENHAGSAYVFERNQGGADQWGQVRKVTASDAATSDWFGHSVAISGDIVVIGAPYDENHAGSAYIFERNKNGADQWGQVRKVTADNAEADDNFGRSVAISGDTVVIGAPNGNSIVGDSGAAYVFERNRGGTADNWGQVQRIAADDAGQGDLFGYAVAISGDTVVAGAPYSDDVCPSNPDCNSGSAYVFARNENGADKWGQVSKLTSADAASEDYFGWSVGISADTTVVGAWGDYSGASSWGGSAYVFERNWGGKDNWGEIKKVTTAATVGELGRSVAVSGDTIVAGASTEDLISGAAYVFVQQGATWTEQQKPIGTDTEAGDRFGYAVAAGGDTAVVGAPYENNWGDYAGAAYVFERNQGGADQWGQVTRLLVAPAAHAKFGTSVDIDGDTLVVGAPGAARAYIFERNTGGANKWGLVSTRTGTAGSEFGQAGAISDDTVVVGAPDEDDGGTNAGAAYIFTRNMGGADMWGTTATLTADDAEAGDRFGHSVDISGDTVVVGAYLDDHGGKTDAGSAYIFMRNESGADIWGPVTKLTVSDAGGGDWFGHSVSISGDTIVVGAPVDDSGSGSAYVFERNGAGVPDTWGQIQKLTADDAAGYDYLGWSVSLSVDTVVAGAYSEDEGGSNAGSAYVFERNQGGADNWGQVQKLITNDAEDGDYFGYGIGISGDVLVIGAYQDDDKGSTSGSAYVYRWVPTHIYLPLVLRNN